jgi:hypothetical protein
MNPRTNRMLLRPSVCPSGVMGRDDGVYSASGTGGFSIDKQDYTQNMT